MTELLWFTAGCFWTMLGVYAISTAGDPDADIDSGGVGTIAYMLVAGVLWPVSLPLMRALYRHARRR